MRRPTGRIRTVATGYLSGCPGKSVGYFLYFLFYSRRITGCFRTGKSRKQTLNQIFLERGKNKCLILKKAENEIVIPLKEIVYISAEDKYTIFHTVETSYFDRVSLQECEEKLEKYAFYRIHRK